MVEQREGSCRICSEVGIDTTTISPLEFHWLKQTCGQAAVGGVGSVSAPSPKDREYFASYSLPLAVTVMNILILSHALICAILPQDKFLELPTG